jgi:hypothetical protein
MIKEGCMMMIMMMCFGFSVLFRCRIETHNISNVRGGDRREVATIDDRN